MLMWLIGALACFLSVPAAAESFAYGRDPAQCLDLYRPAGKGAAPLLLFVHGGGWTAGSKAMMKPALPLHYARLGYAVAAVNYRLVPATDVEGQLADLAGALALLSQKARDLGLDRGHVVLIGHSSGAQLAAMLATDPRWLGSRFGSIGAVVLLDGAGVDVPGIMAAGADHSPFYAAAFGGDLARQRRLSPRDHAAAPNAPRWLMLYDVAHNKAAGYFARRFADALSAAGDTARVIGVSDTTHMRLLENLGVDGDPATALVDRFLTERD